MFTPVLLIDGYNLLHAAGLAQSDYAPGELLRCRTRLLNLLFDRLTPAEIRSTTIIFDAKDPPVGRSSQLRVSGLMVLFANPGGDADVMIQNWLDRCAAPRSVTLVTSDRMLQRAARGYGSRFVGSDEFLKELRRRALGKTETAPQPAESDKPAAGQADYWMKVFGEISLTDVSEDDDPADTKQLAGKEPPPAAAPSAPARPGASRTRSSADDKGEDLFNAADLQEWLQAFAASETEPGPAAATQRQSDLELWLKNYLRDESQ
jgi:uncharacterized protein